MTVVKNLSLPYYSAATDSTLDGAASVQMVLDQIGASPVPTQAVIQAEISANESEPAHWYADPDGIKGALNSLKPPPPTFNNFFVLFSYSGEEEASRKITYTIHRYEVAPIALFYGGGHWVAVKGVQTDVDPLSNSTYAIAGFWIHNPWPGDPYPSSPSEDAWIDYAKWREYFLQVGWGTKWLGKWVSVCDPELPPKGRLRPVERPVPHQGVGLVPRNRVGDFVREEVQALRLDENPGFKVAFNAGDAGEPLLLQLAGGHFDYLVPWRRPDSAAVALFQMDALSGQVRQASRFTTPAKWPSVTHDDVLDQLKAGVLKVVTVPQVAPSFTRPRLSSLTTVVAAFRDRIRMRLGPLPGTGLLPLRSGPMPLHTPKTVKEIKIQPGTWCLQNAPFWVPCWESRSPSYPFFVVTVADQIYFVSTLDGLAYPKLHQFVPSLVPGGGS